MAGAGTGASAGCPHPGPGSPQAAGLLGVRDGRSPGRQEVGNRQSRTRGRRWALRGLGALLLLAVCALGALGLAEPAIAALGCPGCYGFERLAGRLYVDPAMPAETRATLRRAMGEAPDRLARFYGGSASAPVVLACSDEACQRRINGGEALGVAYGSYGLRLSPRGLDRVIVLHELSHIELNARFGTERAVLGVGGVPAWFDERVAVVVSDDPRYLLPEGTPGSRCRADPDVGGPLPDDGREWRHSGAVDHALYARAACRVLRWMDANGGPPAVGRLVAALAEGGRFPDLYREP